MSRRVTIKTCVTVKLNFGTGNTKKTGVGPACPAFPDSTGQTFQRSSNPTRVAHNNVAHCLISDIYVGVPALAG